MFSLTGLQKRETDFFICGTEHGVMVNINM